MLSDGGRHSGDLAQREPIPRSLDVSLPILAEKRKGSYCARDQRLLISRGLRTRSVGLMDNGPRYWCTPGLMGTRQFRKSMPADGGGRVIKRVAIFMLPTAYRQI
jgi:hypothetical protein